MAKPSILPIVIVVLVVGAAVYGLYSGLLPMPSQPPKGGVTITTTGFTTTSFPTVTSATTTGFTTMATTTSSAAVTVTATSTSVVTSGGVTQTATSTTTTAGSIGEDTGAKTGSGSGVVAETPLLTAPTLSPGAKVITGSSGEVLDKFYVVDPAEAFIVGYARISKLALAARYPDLFAVSTRFTSLVRSTEFYVQGTVSFNERWSEINTDYNVYLHKSGRILVWPNSKTLIGVNVDQALKRVIFDLGLWDAVEVPVAYYSPLAPEGGQLFIQRFFLEGGKSRNDGSFGVVLSGSYFVNPSHSLALLPEYKVTVSGVGYPSSLVRHNDRLLYSKDLPAGSGTLSGVLTGGVSNTVVLDVSRTYGYGGGTVVKGYLGLTLSFLIKGNPFDTPISASTYISGDTVTTQEDPVSTRLRFTEKIPYELTAMPRPSGAFYLLSPFGGFAALSSETVAAILGLALLGFLVLRKRR